MKLNRKNILACALCAGLLTLGTAKTQASVVEDELVLNLNVQLTALTTTSKGKVKKIRIGNKDLLSSIGDTTKGDKLVYWLGNEDVWIMDKKGVLQDDLTDEEIFEIDFSSPFSENETSSHRAFTGTVEASFASDSFEDEIDSDLAFDLDGTFSWVETFTQDFGPNDEFFDSVSFNLSNLGNEGFDDNISGDDVPMSGSMTANGSGLLFD